ncbi:hypothetical protein BDN70DRAFT_881645 [Pholiota conissans]|uniref:Uncharacterized protein n=1 Tax=Pholiota conissans TaxID=109636 RepID=A0A9P5YXR8_9AGAR|nr:hypothetical protein BDN70DRAFT_881645 [Pholiota conissans]
MLGSARPLCRRGIRRAPRYPGTQSNNLSIFAHWNQLFPHFPCDDKFDLEAALVSMFMNNNISPWHLTLPSLASPPDEI